MDMKEIDFQSKTDQINPRKFFIILSGFLLISICSFTQWRQVSKGMYGGMVSAFYVDTLSGYMYASCGGVIMSMDNGNTWKAIDSTLVFQDSYKSLGKNRNVRNNNVSAGTRAVYSIVTRGKVLLIGTSAGVYASSDTGKTWTARNNGLISPIIVNCFAFKGSETYIGTSKGVFFSADTGKNWVVKNNPLNADRFYICDLIFIGNDLIAASWSSGAFKSKDKGNTWAESSTGLSHTGSLMRVLEPNGTRIFSGTGRGVYLSVDTGRSWSLLIGRSDSGNFTPNMMEYFMWTNTMGSISIKGDTILASRSGQSADSAKLFMSANGGSSWSNLNIPSHVTGPNSDSETMRYGSQGSFDIFIHRDDFLMGTDFGILRSKDRGISWHSSDKGIMKLGVTALCKSGNRYFAGTSTNGIYVSEDNCNTWQEANNGLVDQNIIASNNKARRIKSLAVKNDTVFVGTGGSGVFYSANGGVSWNAVNSGLYTTQGRYVYGLDIRSLVVSGNQIFAGAYPRVGGYAEGLYVTNNNGNTWTRIFNHAVKAMVTSGNNIYLASPDGVFISRDQGLNWITIANEYTTALGIPYVVLGNGIAVLDNTVFTHGDRVIFGSDDFGRTWKTVFDGTVSGQAGMFIRYMFSRDSVIYVGTGAGVMISNDKGRHWTPIKEGISNLEIQYLGIVDSFIFAGTLNDGLWKRSLSDLPEIPADTSGSNPINVHYVELTGISVYPNPAKNYITISFDDFSDEEYVVEFLSFTGVVLLKTQVNRTLTTINLEELNYHGFCILKVTDSRGNIKAIQKIMRL